MQRQCTSVGLVGLFLLAACAQNSSYRPVDRGLDKAFAFSERDRTGRSHGVSDDAKPDAVKPLRIPTPALIDIDSTLVIRVDPTWAPAGIGGEPDPNGPTLLRRKQQLTELVSGIQAATDIRIKVLDEIGERAGTNEQWSEYDAASQELLRSLTGYARALYADRKGLDPMLLDDSADNASYDPVLGDAFRGSDEYALVSGALRHSGFAGTQAYVEKELAQINAQIVASDAQLESDVKAKSAERGDSVRLFAHILSPGKDPIPLHLRGYDDVKEGRVVQRDRTGLNLSTAEREELARQMEATAQLAETLEGMRTREISARAGLLSILKAVDPELERQVGILRSSVDKLGESSRMELLADAAASVSDMLEENATELGRQLSQEARDLPARIIDSYELSGGALGELSQLAQDIDSLRQTLSEPLTASSVLHTFGEASELLHRVREFAANEVKLNALVKDLSDEMENAASNLQTDAKDIWADTADSDERKLLQALLVSYIKDIQDASASLRAIIKSLEPAGYATESIPHNPTHVFDMPVGDLRDTSLDLTRVDSRPGDRIVVRGQLWAAEDPRDQEKRRLVDETEASFEVTHFGWRGRLSPSVVLVRPNKLANGGETFQFAPVLSWNHHYRPRETSGGELKWLAQVLQPAIGLHTAFLPYDANNGVAIGIGGTVSLWNDRLQFGGGYNLMASSSDDGKVYFFMGSDLIGLLQTLNVGD